MRDLRSRSVAGRAPPSHRAGGSRPDDRRDDPSRAERPRHLRRADGVALGVRRLSIVDVDGGHQPFANEDGTVWAVQNGELYNHDEIRRRSRAAAATASEPLRHGDPAAPLRGARATAFPERCAACSASRSGTAVERRAVVARDRLGIKPLYYARGRRPARLRLRAEEPARERARRAPSSTTRRSTRILTLGFVPGPLTPLAAVSKLMPGHRLSSTAAACATRAYWTLSGSPRRRPDASSDEQARACSRSSRKSVRLRLMSDVPLGAMLSGGLDSSLIVALMARHMTEPVKTFSVGFAEAGDGNELADARARRRALRHRPPRARALVRRADRRPGRRSSGISTSRSPTCRRSASSRSRSSPREHVTVALSGQGADELLGGYRKHRAAAIAGTLAPSAGAAPRSVAALAAGAPSGCGRAARTAAPPPTRSSGCSR